MRRVRIKRMRKKSRNARILGWVFRNKKPVAIVRESGEVVSYIIPYEVDTPLFLTEAEDE